jgi:DNA repair photolyase
MQGATLSGCKITEVEAKSILTRSALADYTLNCYRGCEHGCRYCYARFLTRFSHQGETWGSFVDVKVNAVELLRREARKAPPGRVFLSSVCDGWQPLEAHYGLTRGCLEILRRHGYSLTLLTKSGLALRDLDLLQGGEAELGITLTTRDEGLCSLFEPQASPAAERLRLLEEAKRKGITTFAFLGPLLPFLGDTEENLEELLRGIAEVKVDYFYIDRLNPRFKVWASLAALLQENHPELVEGYRQVLFQEEQRRRYSLALLSTVRRLAEKYGLGDRLRVCFSI